MKTDCVRVVIGVCAVVFCLAAWAQNKNDDPPTMASKRLPAGAKVYISPIEGGFEIYLSAGINKKKVPLNIVTSKEKAEFEISGIPESEKAGWAKMLFAGSAQSNEQASIKVTNLSTSEVVFAYSVNKGNSVRGKQSAAEACAKHLKEKIESQQ